MMKEAGRELIAFSRVWHLDGDVVICRGCKRAFHISHDGQRPSHGFRCPRADAEPVHPWAALRASLSSTETPEPTPEVHHG